MYRQQEPIIRCLSLYKFITFQGGYGNACMWISESITDRYAIYYEKKLNPPPDDKNVSSSLSSHTCN